MVNIDNKKGSEMYEKIREIFMGFKENPTYSYKKDQHHLYEESKYPGISKDYYNEWGKVEFTNKNGDSIVFELSRFHSHQHNGCSGLCASPCRRIIISKKNGEELEELWKLNIVCGTLHYEGEVSTEEIPCELLGEYVPVEEKTDGEDETTEEVEEEEEFDTSKFKEEFNNANNLYLDKVKEKERLISSMNQEIEDSTRRIRESYSKRINDCECEIKSSKKVMENFDKMIVDYSTFDSKMIGNALQYLVSMIECTNYLYRDIPYNYSERVHGVMDSWDEERTSFVKVILLGERDTSSYSENSLARDVSNGKCILLSNGSKRCSAITFCNSSNGEVSYRCDFSTFPYVQEFIDSLIKYRLKKGLVAFKSEDMVLCLKKFLESNQDRILEKYSGLVKSKIGNIQI